MALNMGYRGGNRCRSGWIDCAYSVIFLSRSFYAVSGSSRHALDRGRTTYFALVLSNNFISTVKFNSVNSAVIWNSREKVKICLIPSSFKLNPRSRITGWGRLLPPLCVSSILHCVHLVRKYFTFVNHFLIHSDVRSCDLLLKKCRTSARICSFRLCS